MIFYYRFWLILIFYAPSIIMSKGQSVSGSIKFTVTIEKPVTHYYHVVMECKDVRGGYIDVKLPSWTPGYYWLLNFARNVINFKSVDEQGRALQCYKTTKNTWRVNTNRNKDVVVSYDVYAFTQSVAEPFLDDRYGYISPAGLLMYVDGQLQHTSTITVNSYSQWKTISTGLEPVANEVNTFSAPNFDVLYDSPILLGNQETWSFNVRGIPHYIVLEEPHKFDKQKFIDDLKHMVEVASSVIGEIPYKHYTFLIMGEGRGGLEHQNSTAVFSGGTIYNNGDTASYKRWLNFLTHEYFHLYNSKAIRPIALGPFDYDKENYTNMLWVSEGLTVYYEYLILNRAGILSKEEVLDFLKGNILAYENGTGHHFQSVTQSSFDTWLNFFNHNENTSNTTISYYDKGAALGMLLDLKIRHETKNKKTLDHVMQELYTSYYKGMKRGFTDEEFQQVCESVAGTSLQELFDYASTVHDIDYQKHLAYAGMDIDVTLVKLPGSYLGASFTESDSLLSISGIDFGSPASLHSLSTEDVIIAINGKQASIKTVSDVLKSSVNGDKIKVQYERKGRKNEIEITLQNKEVRSFSITPLPSSSLLQNTIMKHWLKD